jgi:hypothetical protein
MISTSTCGTFTWRDSAKSSLKTSSRACVLLRHPCLTTRWKAIEKRSKCWLTRFEEQNKALGIWYSDTSYRLFLQLQDDVFKLTGLSREMNDWFFNASQLKKWIDGVPDPLQRDLMATRWEECVHISKAKPVTKASNFPAFKVGRPYLESSARASHESTRDG